MCGGGLGSAGKVLATGAVATVGAAGGGAKLHAAKTSMTLGVANASKDLPGLAAWVGYLAIRCRPVPILLSLSTHGHGDGQIRVNEPDAYAS